MLLLGEKLKRLRLQARLSEEKMAQKLGVSRTTVQNYENDSSEPKISTLMLWLKYCRVDIEQQLLLLLKECQKLK